MVLAFRGLAAMVPVALGAAALGHSIFEQARAGTPRRLVDDLAAATAALTSLALFLLSLGPVADAREAGLLVGTAGAVFLSVRLWREQGGEVLFVCMVGILLGGEPGIGIAFLPAVLSILLRVVVRRDGTRQVARAALLFVCGAFVAYLAAGRNAAASVLPTAHGTRVWLGEVTRVGGACACALGAIGLGLALTGGAVRARLALTVTLLLVGSAATGRAGAVGVLALSLAVGLALSEAAAHITSMPLPGVMAALLPLVFVTMLEPMAMRISALHGVWPALGPLPPPDSPTVSHPRSYTLRPAQPKRP